MPEVLADQALDSLNPPPLLFALFSDVEVIVVKTSNRP